MSPSASAQAPAPADSADSASAANSAASASPPADPSAPTPPPSAHRVLLILEAQVAHISAPTAVPAAAALRANLARVLAHARAAAPPPLIVHVRNTGGAGEPDAPHTPGWQLALAPAAGEPVVDKRKNNAFAGTPLGALVAPDAELVVAGVQSDFGVRATCSAALGRGNEVILIRGAHATYDRVEIWSGGTLTPASAIEADIEAELEEAGVVVLEMKDLEGIFSDR